MQNEATHTQSKNHKVIIFILFQPFLSRLGEKIMIYTQIGISNNQLSQTITQNHKNAIFINNH